MLLYFNNLILRRIYILFVKTLSFNGVPLSYVCLFCQSQHVTPLKVRVSEVTFKEERFCHFLNLHYHPSKIYSQQKDDLSHFLNSNIFGSGENFDLQSFCSKFFFALESFKKQRHKMFNALQQFAGNS